MEVVFKGVVLFPGAVVRRLPGRIGLELLARAGLTPPEPGSMLLGAAERRVVLSGRLIGGSGEGVLAQLDAAAELIGDPPGAGELVVGGVSMGELYLLGVRLVGPIDNGQAFSAAFEAVLGEITDVDKE